MTAVANSYVPTNEDRSVEAKLDIEHLRHVRAHFGKIRWSALPNAFKSWYATEGSGWTADIKVDYDLPDGTALGTGNRPKEPGAQRVKAYLKRQGFVVRALRAYTTRKGLHLRIWMRTKPEVEVRLLDWEEVLQIQEWLNDDARRRDFNQIRVNRLEDGWNVLWSEKWHSGELISGERFDPEWTATFARWLGVEVDDGGFGTIRDEPQRGQEASAHGGHAGHHGTHERRRAFAHRVAHSALPDDGPEGDGVRHRGSDSRGGDRALSDLVIERARELLARIDETGMLIAGDVEDGEAVRANLTALRAALTDLDAAQVEAVLSG